VRDVFTEKDVLRGFPHFQDGLEVGQIKPLGRGVATATTEAVVLDALRFMIASGIRHLPIVVPGKSQQEALMQPRHPATKTLIHSDSSNPLMRRTSPICGPLRGT